MTKKDKKRSGKKRRRIPTIQSVSIPNQIRKARNYPIIECFITAGWEEKGMANIFISRMKPEHDFVVGIYLIDFWCLGLKDTACRIDVTHAEIMESIENKGEKFELISSNRAHSIIYGAIDYAEKLGFKPHSDFKYTRLILNPREEFDLDKTIEFGKDGKPCYFAGPYDTQDRINKILATLTENVGEGNFNYTIIA